MTTELKDRSRGTLEVGGRRFEIYRLRVRLMDDRVPLVAHQVTQGMPHGGGLDETGGELVEQGLKRVVAVAVDQDHLRVRLLELLRRADTGEASAEDQDARARWGCVAGRIHDAQDHAPFLARITLIG